MEDNHKSGEAIFSGNGICWPHIMGFYTKGPFEIEKAVYRASTLFDNAETMQTFWMRLIR